VSVARLPFQPRRPHGISHAQIFLQHQDRRRSDR
jgi:hypothetical protein